MTTLTPESAAAPTEASRRPAPGSGRARRLLSYARSSVQRPSVPWRADTVRFSSTVRLGKMPRSCGTKPKPIFES